MVLLIFTVVLFIVVLAGHLIAKSILEKDLEHESNEKKEKAYKIIKKTVFLTPLIFLLILTGIFTSVGPNQVGIIFDEVNGGIQDKTLGQGIHIKSPFQTVTNINTSNQIRYVNTFGQSKDGNSVDYQVTLTIYVATPDAGKFFRKTNSTTISEQHLNTLVKEAIQKVSSRYEVFDIIGSKVEDVRSEIEEEVRNLLEKEYFITLAALTVEDVDAGDDIEKALEKKAEEKLKLEVAEAEKARALVEAETAIIRAENEATVTILKAEADAEAQAILNAVAVTAIQNMYERQFDTEEARTDFETNQVGGYLTIVEIGEIVIKQLYYDVWDGKLPSVITDGDGIIIQP